MLLFFVASIQLSRHHWMYRDRIIPLSALSVKSCRKQDLELQIKVTVLLALTLINCVP